MIPFLDLMLSLYHFEGYHQIGLHPPLELLVDHEFLIFQIAQKFS